MSQADLKQVLRKLDFPACAEEALPKIESYIVSRSKQQNFAMQLISEFVFLERNKDNENRKAQMLHMSCFQEFQLIITLLDYFGRPASDANRNAVFLSLFGSNLTPQRSKLLARLISTAISGIITPVLESAGAWMQQVGCTTPPSLEVAQCLISDFITFSRKTYEQLKQMPFTTPHFSANLMTAVTDLYLNERNNGSLIAPPDELLELFCEWISECSTLCMASLQPLALPAGAIAMPVITPLAGLIRWVVLAPLVSQSIIFSNLHLRILQTMQQIEVTVPPVALNAQQLAQLVPPIQAFTDRLVKEGKKPDEDPSYKLCVERLAQAVQVALSSRCVYGNIPQLLCILETLPAHPLMKMIINVNRNNYS